MSFQSIKHEQAIAAVRRELEGLRSKPSLDGVVEELQARNNEMEELLKSKCSEIEENDDRFIE